MHHFVFKPVQVVPARKKFGGVVGPLIFLLVAAAALAVFYFASLSKGSREEFAETQRVVVNPEEAEKALADSRSSESQFNSIHEFKKDEITDGDVDIYERAVDAYKRYLAYSGAASAYNPRYEQMRKTLHDLRTDILRKRSTQLEIQAEDLASEKKYSDAEKLFAAAAGMEYRITKDFPLATKKNHARANFLENRARTMQAIPLQFKAKQLQKEGEAALNAANWPKAGLCLNEALAIEKKLWSDYRNIIVSNSANILRLQTLITTVRSAPEYERRERDVADARVAEQKGDWKAAAAAWSSALDRQNTIMQNFSQSLYADKTIAQELERNLANANAQPLFLQLKNDYEEMRAEIRSRKTDRVPMLAKQNLRRAEEILREWPNSSLISEKFLQELRYLDVKSSDIAGVQNSFFKLLVPVPGADENLRMMKTEVSQALYTFIMPFNPSARKAHENPVESVDFNDAQEFCRRISLLVGCKVRLPSQSEYAAAAGTPDENALLPQAWLLENSSGLVHAVGKRAANAAGFFDLYGNVAEWVTPDAESAGTLKNYETFLAGGDCQTPLYSFPHDFFKPAAVSEKSRTRGFRIVAELAVENESGTRGNDAASAKNADADAEEPDVPASAEPAETVLADTAK